MTNPLAEAARRRTFAIISHPDAGKTTLTEKFLLYGGALTSEAGSVKARGERRSEVCRAPRTTRTTMAPIGSTISILALKKLPKSVALKFDDKP